MFASPYSARASSEQTTIAKTSTARRRSQEETKKHRKASYLGQPPDMKTIHPQVPNMHRVHFLPRCFARALFYRGFVVLVSSRWCGTFVNTGEGDQCSTEYRYGKVRARYLASEPRPIGRARPTRCKKKKTSSVFLDLLKTLPAKAAAWVVSLARMFLYAFIESVGVTVHFSFMLSRRAAAATCLTYLHLQTCNPVFPISLLTLLKPASEMLGCFIKVTIVMLWC